MSRCCANAPSHHPHRWPYFHRVKRGVYEIRAGYRDAEPLEVADAAATYELGTVSPRQSIHAVVVESEGLYVAECLEIAIVTQGATLDETLAHLRDAIDLYMADEESGRRGRHSPPAPAGNAGRRDGPRVAVVGHRERARLAVKNGAAHKATRRSRRPPGAP